MTVPGFCPQQIDNFFHSSPAKGSRYFAPVPPLLITLAFFLALFPSLASAVSKNCAVSERSAKIREKFAELTEKLTTRYPVKGAVSAVSSSPSNESSGLRADFGQLLFVMEVDRNEVSTLSDRVAALEKQVASMRPDLEADPDDSDPRKSRPPGAPACRDTHLPIALVAGWEKFSLSKDGSLGLGDGHDRGMVGLSKNIGRIDVSAFLNGWAFRCFVPHDPSLRAVSEIFKVNGVGDGTYSLTEASLSLKEFVVSASYAFGDSVGRRVFPRAGASVKRNTLRLELTPLDSSDAPVFTAMTRRGFFSGEFFAGLSVDLNKAATLAVDGVYTFGGITVQPSYTEIFEKYGDGTPALAQNAARTAADRLSDKGFDFSAQGWSLRAATSLRFR